MPNFMASTSMPRTVNLKRQYRQCPPWSSFIGGDACLFGDLRPSGCFGLDVFAEGLRRAAGNRDTHVGKLLGYAGISERLVDFDVQLCDDFLRCPFGSQNAAP